MTEKKPAKDTGDLPPHPGVQYQVRGGDRIRRFLKPLQHGERGRRKKFEAEPLPGTLRAEYPVRRHVHTAPPGTGIDRLPAIGAVAHVGSEPDNPQQMQFKVV
jgi:hypothetical protein